MRTDEGSTYEEWMNEIAADVQDELPLPPVGHPLHELGKRLAHYLDDDKFNETVQFLNIELNLLNQNPHELAAQG